MGVPPDGDAALTAYAMSLIQTKSLQICRKPGFTPSDIEEVAQELARALLGKWRRYDPGRGASFDTFANRVVVSAARMLLRERRRVKRAAGFTAQSIDAPSADVGGAAVPLIELLVDGDRQRLTGAGAADPRAAAERAEAVSHVLAALPPLMAAIAKGLMEGTVASVGRDLNLPRREMQACVQRLREQFRRAGFESAE